MGDIPRKVRRFMQHNQMLEGAGLAVVAVSGGPDSVALLDILLRLKPAGISLELHVAHLDHMLRGDHSAEDARFVKALAERHRLRFTIASADVKAQAASARRGIEETARECRYAFFLEVARRIGADLILTGHTMSDQAETFLMRLARGSGLAGLAAMRPVSPVPQFSSVEEAASPAATQPLLARPLLCLTREEIERYCQETGLEFRRDATNFDIGYTRNRLRQQVLPALLGLNPRIVETIARAAETIASDDAALDDLAHLGLRAARIQTPDCADNRIDNRIGNATRAYSTDSLRGHPAGLIRRILIAAIEEQKAALRCINCSAKRERASLQITAKHVAAVESLLEGASGRRVVLPGDICVWSEPGALVFTRGQDKSLYQLDIDGLSATVSAAGFQLRLLRGEPVASLPAARTQARDESLHRGRDWMVALLDDTLLPQRLIVRPRRSGERALVLGQKRIKKLKNLMIDHKIPVSRRQTWPTVVTPGDEYVWSPGLPPSVQFAAHDKTQRLAIFHAIHP